MLSRNRSLVFAVLALGRLGAGGEAVLAAAKKALSDDAPLVKSCAALALFHLGAAGEEVQRTLAALPEQDSGEDLQLLEVLQGFPEESQAMLPALIKALEPEHSGAIAACKLIAQLGRAGTPAVPALKRLSQQARMAGHNPGFFGGWEWTSPTVIEAATEALQKLEPP